MAELNIPVNVTPDQGLVFPCLTKKCRKRNCDVAEAVKDAQQVLNASLGSSTTIGSRTLLTKMTNTLNRASRKCGSSASVVGSDDGMSIFDRLRLSGMMDRIAIATGLNHPVMPDVTGDYAPIVSGLLDKLEIADNVADRTGSLQDEAYAQLLLKKFKEGVSVMTKVEPCPYPNQLVRNPITGQAICSNPTGIVNGRFTTMDRFGNPTVTTMANGRVVSVNGSNRTINVRTTSSGTGGSAF